MRAQNRKPVHIPRVYYEDSIAITNDVRVERCGNSSAVKLFPNATARAATTSDKDEITMNRHTVRTQPAAAVAAAGKINTAVQLGLILLFLMAGSVWAIDSTITVNRLTGRDGTFHIQFAVNGKIGSADISVEPGDDRHAVAQKIASAIGNGAKAVGNKVTFEPGSGGGGSVDVNNIVVTTGNNDIFPACGLHSTCASAGTMFFGPNSFNGEDHLLSDTLVTAGFANGLPQASFDAPTGESISDLTLQLNTALDAGGYTTQLLNSTHIEVFSNGSLNPTELDLTLDPLGSVGDRGILYGLNTPVPEPSTLTLCGTVLLGIAGIARRRSRGMPLVL